MASWDDTQPTKIAVPTMDFSALGSLGDDYAKAQKQKAALAEQQRQQLLRQQQLQGQAPPDGASVNPQTGQPNYAATASPFLQNSPGLASRGLTSFGNTIGNFLVPGGIGSPT